MSFPALPAKTTDFNVPFSGFILLEREPNAKKTGTWENIFHLVARDAKLITNVEIILRRHDANCLSCLAKIIDRLHSPIGASAFKAGEEIGVMMKSADDAGMKSKENFRRIAHNFSFKKCRICDPLLHLLAG